VCVCVSLSLSLSLSLFCLHVYEGCVSLVLRLSLVWLSVVSRFHLIRFALHRLSHGFSLSEIAHTTLSVSLPLCLSRCVNEPLSLFLSL
jgi:hypothetical protein